MALPDSAKKVKGTPLVFASSGVYSPTDPGQPDSIDADINLDGVGSGGVCWQAVKLNLGSVNLDLEWEMKVYIEFHTAPTAGGTVAFALGWSGSATAGEDNPGNLSGANVVYQGYGADTPSGTEAFLQLDYIGELPVTNDADLQVKVVGKFRPRDQYAILVVQNNTDQNLCDTDAIETGVAVYPWVLQAQD